MCVVSVRACAQSLPPPVPPALLLPASFLCPSRRALTHLPASTHPKYTRQQIQAFLDARPPAAAPAGDGEEAGEEAEEEAEEARPAKKAKSAGGGKKKKAPGGMEPALSPALADFVGAPRMHRFKIVKAIWAYIKAHDLQDPADKRAILPDARLGTILTAPVTRFSMNKQLNAHILKE